VAIGKIQDKYLSKVSSKTSILPMTMIKLQ